MKIPAWSLVLCRNTRTVPGAGKNLSASFLGSDKRINPGFTSVASYERQPKLSPVFGRTRWVSGSNCMIAQRLLFHPSPTKVSRFVFYDIRILVGVDFDLKVSGGRLSDNTLRS